VNAIIRELHERPLNLLLEFIGAIGVVWSIFSAGHLELDTTKTFPINKYVVLLLLIGIGLLFSRLQSVVLKQSKIASIFSLAALSLFMGFIVSDLMKSFGLPFAKSSDPKPSEVCIAVIAIAAFYMLNLMHFSRYRDEWIAAKQVQAKGGYVLTDDVDGFGAVYVMMHLFSGPLYVIPLLQ
jgi:hypothetical protein